MSIQSEFSWQRDGACVDLSDEQFNPFISKTDSEKVKRNKKVCADCLVREECLNYGYKTRSEGMWGGKFTADAGDRSSIALYNTLKQSQNVSVSTKPVTLNIPVFKLQIPQ